MMKSSLILALAAFAGTVSAQGILVPDGDFEAADHSPFWAEASGGPSFAYPTDGGPMGAGDGFASIDATGGEWAVLVNPIAPGNAGGGLDISTFGLAGGDPIQMTMDMINLQGTGTGGLKIEAWAGNAIVGSSGDMAASGQSTSWATYTFDWTLPASTEKIIIVPLWGANSEVGYDNIGVPEPSAFALIGGLLALGFIVRRRR